MIKKKLTVALGVSSLQFTFRSIAFGFRSAHQPFNRYYYGATKRGQPVNYLSDINWFHHVFFREIITYLGIHSITTATTRV